VISARSIGVLFEIATTDVAVSAEALATHFSEGRDAIRTCLKELQNAGYIYRTRQKIDGKWVTASGITSAGFQRLETRLLIQRNVQSSNNKVIPYSYKTIINPPAEPVGEEKEPEMGYDFFDKTSSLDRDERAAEKAKWETAKQKDYDEKRAATSAAKYQSRASIPLQSWTVSDVANEFSAKLAEHWNIRPFSVVQSRFVPALATVRRQHATTGDVEVEVMRRFFDSISLETYDDPELLWKMFIKRFPSFLSQVRNMALANEEVTEEAKVRTAKGASRLED